MEKSISYEKVNVLVFTKDDYVGRQMYNSTT